MKNCFVLLLLIIPFFVCAQKKLGQVDLDVLKTYMLQTSEFNGVFDSTDSYFAVHFDSINQSIFDTLLACVNLPAPEFWIVYQLIRSVLFHVSDEFFVSMVQPLLKERLILL